MATVDSPTSAPERREHHSALRHRPDWTVLVVPAVCLVPGGCSRDTEVDRYRRSAQLVVVRKFDAGQSFSPHRTWLVPSFVLVNSSRATVETNSPRDVRCTGGIRTSSSVHLERGHPRSPVQLMSYSPDCCATAPQVAQPRQSHRLNERPDVGRGGTPCPRVRSFQFGRQPEDCSVV